MWPFKKKQAKTKTHGARGSASNDDFEFPAGAKSVKVEGTAWCKVDLPDSDDVLVSLTPRNGYQRDAGWPEEGIVNVNRAGSRRTAEGNWIGYIPAAQAAPFLRIVMENGTTYAHARVTDSAKTIYLIYA
jgi:hypothetical protein